MCSYSRMMTGMYKTGHLRFAFHYASIAMLLVSFALLHPDFSYGENTGQQLRSALRQMLERCEREAQKVKSENVEANRRLDYLVEQQSSLSSILKAIDKLEQDTVKAIALMEHQQFSQAKEFVAPNKAWLVLESAKALPENLQTLLAQELRPQIDLSISIARRVPPDLPADYTDISDWKGQQYTRSRRLQLARRNEQMKPLFDELDEIDSSLARLFATSSSDDSEVARTQREQLLFEKDGVMAKLWFERSRLPMMIPTPLVSALPSGVSLVDYFIYTDYSEKNIERERMMAFIIHGAKLIQSTSGPPLQHAMIDLGAVAPISAAIERWRSEIARGRGGLADDSQDAPQRFLANQLWGIIQKHLTNTETVLLSPDGPLAFLPFDALPSGTPDMYLFEERRIVIAPVPRLIAADVFPIHRYDSRTHQTEDKKQSSGLLLVGDLDFYHADRGSVADASGASLSGQTFPALPGTRKEIESIRQSFEHAFPSATVKVLDKEYATKPSLSSSVQQKNWLHLATHGYFEDESQQLGLNPTMRTGLALSGFNVSHDQSALLTAFEVSSLDMIDVDLAVLSACETNLGQIRSGEGILSLQRAFQLAGAKSTVTSLWKVDDKATQVFMSKFYENLWVKKLDKLDALRQARREMLSDFDVQSGALRGLDQPLEQQTTDVDKRLPPYYWAAFVLSGDWR